MNSAQFLVGASVAAMAFLHGSDAAAQNSAGLSTTSKTISASVSQEAGLQDIIVTAQRRSENLQKAAIAVTAVSGDTLVRAGVTDSTQLTRIAPSLQISNLAGSNNAFYLRGVGNFTTNSLSDSAISFNVDGVSFARTQAAVGVFYDLDRVEVLKGPQGTLYGRNATGGAINLITAKPRAGEFSGYGNFEYGNYDAKRFTGAINIPLGEDGALRVAGQATDRDGFYSDGTGDDKTRSLRVQMASQLNDTIKVTVGADYTFQGGVGAGATALGLDKDKRIGLLDPRAANLFLSSFSFLAGNTLYPLEDDVFNHNKFWGMYAQADVDTSVGTLTILPAYRNMKLFQRSISSGFAVSDRYIDDQTSLEVRLSSRSGAPLGYIFGLYYLNEDSDQPVNYNQQYFSPYSDFQSQTRSYAGFARLSYNVTERFRLTGGARYTIDKKSAILNSVNTVVICPAVFVGGACPNTPPLPSSFTVPDFLRGPNGAGIPVQPYGPSGAIVQANPFLNAPSKTFRKPTFRGSVEFDLGSQSLLYASAETGFKSGGFFSSIDNPIYQPETITAFTIGSKNRFFDNRLQVNLEAFHWTYKDQQVSHFRTNTVGGTEFVTENIGKSRIQGIELEIQAKPVESTTLNTTVQYLDARNKEFVYTNPAALGPPVSGCAVTGPAAGLFTVDCSGRRPVNAPVWTVTGGIEQIVALGSAGQLIFNVDARYQSKSFTGFEELSSQIQNGYALLDVQLTYKPEVSHFTISVFANNLTDKTVVGFAQPHPRAAALVTQTLRPPRTYGVRVGYKF